LRKHTLLYYASEKHITHQGGAYIDDVEYRKSGIHFSLIWSTQTLRIESNFIDKDFMDFIVPASLVAKVLHVPMGRVEVFAANASPPSSMFSLKRSKKRVYCINGSNITSVDKIIRKVDYLRVFGSSTIVILGRLSAFTSKKDMLLLGNALNEISGSVILLQHEYLRPLRAGMKDQKGNSKIVCLNLAQAQKLVGNAGANEKILLLGLGTDSLLHTILNNS
jgi:UDP-N-acetylmuramyl pentapeptide synthase